MHEITICSFYTAGGYYEECAEKLRNNMQKLGVHLHLEEMVVPEGKTWPEICRQKIPFLHRVRQANRDRLLFWIDVDCQLLRLPDFVRNSSADLIGFQRGFGDPLAIGYATKTRFWEPSFLGFGRSEAAQRFLETAYDLERTTDIYATDDYFFEEAWRREAANLTFQVIPSALSRAETPGQFFLFGSSSNVRKYQGTVKQHASPLNRKHLTPIRSVARRLALRYLPEPAISAILTVRDQIQSLTAASNVKKVEADSSRQIALKDFNILVKRAYAFNELSPERLSTIASSVAGDPKAVQASLEWGRAFKAYRDEGSVRTPIPLVWWDSPSPGNFGDWLSPYIFANLEKRPIHYVKPDSSPGKPHLIAVGSIAKFAQANSIVFGSGIAHRNTQLHPGATYISVRGPHTADCLKQSGGRVPDVLGDPGILMSKLYQPRTTGKTGTAALVRHIRHQGLDIQMPSYMKELSILASQPAAIERLVDELVTMDFVITSAMHCFIVCQSYDIPCALVTFEGLEDAVPGDGIKYRDYLSGVGQKEFSPVVLPTDLRNIDLHNWIVDERISQRIIGDLVQHAQRAASLL